MGLTKGTKIDVDFQMLEKKTDRIENVIEEVIDKTEQYLQPNPAYRIGNRLMKAKNSTKNLRPYPQVIWKSIQNLIKLLKTMF